MKVITTITSGSLTVGRRVEGESVGYTKTGREAFRSTWSGIYDGQRSSEWDGTPSHYFRDGEINGTAQELHGFPVAQITAAEV